MALLEYLLPRNCFLRWGENCRSASLVGLPVLGGAVEVEFARLNSASAASLRLILHVLGARELKVAVLGGNALHRSIKTMINNCRDG